MHARQATAGARLGKDASGSLRGPRAERLGTLGFGLAVAALLTYAACSLWIAQVWLFSAPCQDACPAPDPGWLGPARWAVWVSLGAVLAVAAVVGARCAVVGRGLAALVAVLGCAVLLSAGAGALLVGYSLERSASLAAKPID